MCLFIKEVVFFYSQDLQTRISVAMASPTGNGSEPDADRYVGIFHVTHMFRELLKES